MNGRCSLLLALALLAMPLSAQSLTDQFKNGFKTWELALERGDGAQVRRSTEGLLQKEGQTISRSDYNEMRSLVAVLDMTARACVIDGAWEDAVSYLQRADSTAAENLATAGKTFAKIRKDHEEKLAEWKEAATKTESKIKDLDAFPGLTQDMIKQRATLKDTLDEHRNAIAHSEWAIKEIDALLDRLKKDQESDAKSLAAWQAFLAAEKQDIEAAGSTQAYVVKKLAQIVADTGRPRAERLAYGRRLMRLDPSNKACKSFVGSLLGVDEASAAPARLKPTPARKRRTRSTKP